jgi:hypothetical protein
LNLTQDTDLIAFALAILKEMPTAMQEEARAYVDDLMRETPESRQHLIGFLFFHEIVDGDQIHEGATLSFGRKHKKRYRDRLDIIFEAPVNEGHADPFFRVRIFVDPFQGVKPPVFETECLVDFLTTTPAAFERLCTAYKDWESEQGRPRDH